MNKASINRKWQELNTVWIEVAN